MYNPASESWNAAESIRYYPAHWRSEETLVTRLTRAVAEVEDVSPEAIPPIWHDKVDLDALERLFGEFGGTEASMSIRALDHMVRIHADLSFCIVEGAAEADG